MRTIFVVNKKCSHYYRCVMLVAVGLFLVTSLVEAHPQKQGTRRVTNSSIQGVPNNGIHCEFSATKVSDFGVETIVRCNNSCFKEETINAGGENSSLREVWLHDEGKKLLLFYVDGVLRNCKIEDNSMAEECFSDLCNTVEFSINPADLKYHIISQPKVLSWIPSAEDLRQECLNWHKMQQNRIVVRKQRGQLSLMPSRRSRSRHRRGIFSELTDFIAPGTKWCGWGNRAKKYSDLGGFSEADTCCRKHDTRCRYWIPAFKSRYGLINTGFSTMMHCACDDSFRACLKMANTSPANFIGKVFFNMVSTECFILKKEQVCKKWSWRGKCKRYVKRDRAYIRKNSRY